MTIACSASERSLEASPFAELFSECPSGWSEKAADYDAPPKGTAYEASGAQSKSLQICSGDGTWRWVVITTFRTGAAAERSLVGFGTSVDWSPPPSADHAARFSYQSDASECVRADDGVPFEECVVGDSLAVVVGTVLVEVTAEDRDARVDIRRLRLGFQGVIGDPRHDENEQILTALLEGLLKQRPVHPDDA